MINKTNFSELSKICPWRDRNDECTAARKATYHGEFLEEDCEEGTCAIWHFVKTLLKEAPNAREQ